jgi:hypothetical protein
MSCMTLTAQGITMSTMQFKRAVCYERCAPVEEYRAPRQERLRMNWIVVTDENGNRRLQMGWHADREH